MGLRNRTPISTKPGGPYADKGAPTEYQASCGWWCSAEDKPTPGAGGDRTEEGRNSGLSKGRRR
ncbi:hypothetical protein L0F81_33810 [Streptomyces tricolor]|uniref:Uncharacterized protein n=1 Tax=Streptomyces tricolor TaxID=68277 RepID=A0ABS9JRJ6_9ACTN|nr:hypothetical protein [Streptomyces tricolor]MCG0068185.1 hypothetical protein [Streptomyces tricolor]